MNQWQIPRLNENVAPLYHAESKESRPVSNSLTGSHLQNVPMQGLNTQQSKTSKEPITNKIIATQLAPEDFSLEDVQHLQRSIRELHVENIQKTLAYVNLEQAYHCLEDEINSLKNAEAKRKEESNNLLKTALNEITVHQKRFCNSEGHGLSSRKLDDILKELDQYKEKCKIMEIEEAKLKRQIDVYEEKYDYFNRIISYSTDVLANSKENLEAFERKSQILEEKLALYMERCQYYEKLQHDSIDGRYGMLNEAIAVDSTTYRRNSETESSASSTSQPRSWQLDKKFIDNAIVKHLKSSNRNPRLF